MSTITFQAVNFTATKTLLSFAEKKVQKIFKQYPDAIRIDVSFKTGSQIQAKSI